MTLSSSPALCLALREMRGGIKGFRVFLICLALGVGAIAAVGSIAAAVRAGLDADAQRILGGDVSLGMAHREITPQQRSWLGATGTLSRTVLMRSMAHARGFHISASLDFERYWDRVITRIQQAAWWLSPEPDDVVEKEAWCGRAALLDSLCYEGS